MVFRPGNWKNIYLGLVPWMNMIGGCGGGRERRKMNWSCVKFDSFSSQGSEFTPFSFSSYWVSLLWREILTFRLKEVKRSLNHIICDVLSGWVEGERGGKVTPASFQFLLQKLAPGSPLEFCDSWSAFLLADSNELATQIPISLASPRASVPKSKPILGRGPVTEGGQDSPWKTHPSPMSLCFDLSEIPLGAWDGDQGRIWVWNPTSTTYYLQSCAVVNHQTLDANVNDFLKIPNICLTTLKNHVVTPSSVQCVDVFSIGLLHR